MVALCMSNQVKEAQAMIRMGNLNVPDHGDVADWSLRHAEWKYPGYRDHHWGDDWTPAVNFHVRALEFPLFAARGGRLYDGWEADNTTFARFFVSLLMCGWDLWNGVHHYGPGTADHLKLSPRMGEGFYLRATGDLIYGGRRGVEVVLTALRKCQLPDLSDPDVRHQAVCDVAQLIHLAEGKPDGFPGRDWEEAEAWLAICLKAKSLHEAATRPASQVAAQGAAQETTQGGVALEETVWEAAGYGVPMEQQFLDGVMEWFLQRSDWALKLLRRRACPT
jgi:hypothetical protein